MTTIAANSSASDPLVSKPYSGAPVNASSTVPPLAFSDSSANGSSSPIVTVNLSDRAKAVLERSKIDQVVASRLQAFVQSLRTQSSGKPADAVNKAPSSEGFTGSSAGGPSGKTFGSDQDLGDYFNSIVDAQRKPDGSMPSFTTTVSDVLNVPSTDDWYKTDGQADLEAAAQLNDPAYNEFAAAIRNHQVTVQSAQDISDLNFHNTWTIQGGDGGVSINGASSYNHNASIFQDPTMNVTVSGNGTVISWPKTQTIT